MADKTDDSTGEQRISELALALDRDLTPEQVFLLVDSLVVLKASATWKQRGELRETLRLALGFQTGIESTDVADNVRLALKWIEALKNDPAMLKWQLETVHPGFARLEETVLAVELKKFREHKGSTPKGTLRRLCVSLPRKPFSETAIKDA